MPVTKDKQLEFVDFVEFLKYRNSLTQTELSEKTGFAKSVFTDAKNGRLSERLYNKILETFADDYKSYKSESSKSAKPDPEGDRELHIYYKAKY